MGSGENKAVMRRIFDEVINRKSLDLVGELYSEEHELHPDAPGLGRGPEGMKRVTRFSGGRAVESWEVIDTGRSEDSPPW